MRPHRLRVTAFGAFGGTAEVCFDDLASRGPVPAARRDRRGQDHAAGCHRVRPVRPGARRARQGPAAALGSRRGRHVHRSPARGHPRRPPDADHPQARAAAPQAPRRRHHHRAGQGPARGVTTAPPGGPSPPGPARPTTRSKTSWACPPSSSTRSCCCPRACSPSSCTPTADKRAELLEQLFGTDRFGEVEDWLAERRRTTARAVDDAEQAVRELAAVIAQVAGPDSASPDSASPDSATRSDSASPDSTAPRHGEARSRRSARSVVGPAAGVGGRRGGRPRSGKRARPPHGARSGPVPAA